MKRYRVTWYYEISESDVEMATASNAQKFIEDFVCQRTDARDLEVYDLKDQKTIRWTDLIEVKSLPE